MWIIGSDRVEASLFARCHSVGHIPSFPPLPSLPVSPNNPFFLFFVVIFLPCTLNVLISTHVFSFALSPLVYFSVITAKYSTLTGLAKAPPDFSPV